MHHAGASSPLLSVSWHHAVCLPHALPCLLRRVLCVSLVSLCVLPVCPHAHTGEHTSHNAGPSDCDNWGGVASAVDIEGGNSSLGRPDGVLGMIVSSFRMLDMAILVC